MNNIISSHAITFKNVDISNYDMSITVQDIENDIHDIIHRLPKDYSVKLHNDKYSGVCISSDYKHMDIHIGAKTMYDMIHAHHATYDSIAVLYRELYHELGHADSYAKLYDYISNFKHNRCNTSLSDIYFDNFIINYMPEYEIANYEILPAEKYAEAYSMTHTYEHFSKSKVFDTEKYEHSIISSVNNAVLWYGKRPIKSVKPAVTSLYNELRQRDLKVLKPLSKTKLSSVTDYFERNSSDMPVIRADSSLCGYLDKAQTISELRSRCLNVIETLHPGTFTTDKELAELYKCMLPNGKLPQTLCFEKERHIIPVHFEESTDSQKSYGG